MIHIYIYTHTNIYIYTHAKSRSIFSVCIYHIHINGARDAADKRDKDKRFIKNGEDWIRKLSHPPIIKHP